MGALARFERKKILGGRFFLIALRLLVGGKILL